MDATVWVLKADGSIVAWGNNGYGQTNVPAPNSGFVAVAAGGEHSLGLQANDCPADIDGDGDLDAKDFFAYLDSLQAAMTARISTATATSTPRTSLGIWICSRRGVD